MSLDLSRQFVLLRRNHAAWLLLASRNGPLILAGLKSLTDAHPSGVAFDDAVEHIAGTFADHAHDSEFELGDDYVQTARRELRAWMKRGLIVERDGVVLTTDDLQRALVFLESLEDRPMTSTASRLATVQRAIEELDARLSDSQKAREESLQQRIDSLQRELDDVRSGRFDVLDGPAAEEGIREVYQLAVSLRSDFRRVEDSYREADRSLRQRILGEQHHRGEIVDDLLDSHEQLLKTTEGQVFDSFHHQLVNVAELDRMKDRLKSILRNRNSKQALDVRQKADLKLLVSRLVQESERVIQARARSERDVRGFLKSGLVDEQIRVGAILQDVFQEALQVDWERRSVRRTAGPLPAIAIAASNLPVMERLMIRQFSTDDKPDLDLTVTEANPTELDDEFWYAWKALDRAALFEATLKTLSQSQQALTISALANALPPTHDLETLAYWLAMAREAGVPLDDHVDVVDLFRQDDGWTRFYTPLVQLNADSVRDLKSGTLE